MHVLSNAWLKASMGQEMDLGKRDQGAQDHQGS